MAQRFHGLAVYEHNVLRGVEHVDRPRQMAAKLTAFAREIEILETLNELRIDADGNVRMIFGVPKMTDDAKADEMAIVSTLDGIFQHGIAVSPYRGG